VLQHALWLNKKIYITSSERPKRLTLDADFLVTPRLLSVELSLADLVLGRLAPLTAAASLAKSPVMSCTGLVFFGSTSADEAEKRVK